MSIGVRRSGLRAAVLTAAAVMLAAAAQAAPSAEPETETARLRRENAELRDKLLKSETALRRLRLWMAELAETGEAAAPAVREERLLSVLNALARSGGDLAVKSAGVCDEFSAVLKDAKFGGVRQAQLSLMLDDLRSAARQFILQTDEGVRGADTLNSCRVLAVDAKLRIAVLSAGSDQGVFPGVVYRNGAGNDAVLLQVSGVGPGASAATLIRGRFSDLRPGMTVTAVREDPEKRSFILPQFGK